MKVITVESESLATILESILYGYEEEYEEALEIGFDGIERLVEILRESDKTFYIKAYGEDQR